MPLMGSLIEPSITVCEGLNHLFGFSIGDYELNSYF